MPVVRVQIRAHAPVPGPPSTAFVYCSVQTYSMALFVRRSCCIRATSGWLAGGLATAMQRLQRAYGQMPRAALRILYVTVASR